MEEISKLGPAMTVQIYVVAANQAEFHKFLNESHRELDKDLKNKAVRFVEHSVQLESEPARVFLWGNYFKRHDWPVIEEIIKRRGHRKLLVR